jgi:L-alanine-DL-glutamate epimerase-like enolase superfamily enzyme
VASVPVFGTQFCFSLYHSVQVHDSNSSDMTQKITSVSVERIERPFARPFRNAKVRMETLSYLRTAVRAGDVIGHGEMTAMPGYSPETIASMVEAIQAHFAPAIVGLEPFDGAVEVSLESALPANAYARSAVELALWDLRGRLLDAPVHALIGGAVRRRIPIGAIVTLGVPEAMAEDAARWYALGARTFQVKIAQDARSSEARVRAVRGAVGDDATLAVDGNGSFTVSEAMRTMDAIAPHRPAFFEQPVAAWDIDGLAALVRRGIIPIVPDECLVTSHDALRLWRAGAADGFNLKLAKSGISETRRIMAIADAAGIPYGLGAMLETHFGTLAGIHMAATIRQPLFAAELVGPWMVRDPKPSVPEFDAATFEWLVPQGPGWGADPD